MDELIKEHECNGDCAHCGDECDVNGGTVTLTLDDDSVVECAILSIFPAGEKEYIALLPLDENGENHDGEVFLYRFTENDTDGPSLENIEDDDEYDLAVQAFDAMIEQAEEDEEEITEE